ncbi:MAG: oligosaccharide flippase family protein [Rhodobacteraceae bacterium]|nr:oligosaccharide flippase family protein [Paracoccaceae bacterium]
MAGGAALTAVARAYAQLTQLVIFVVAARVLGPEEFGFFVLVSAFAYIALKVSEAGWAEYIMAWSGDIHMIRCTYGISWISGAVMMVIGLLATAAVSMVAQHPETQLLVAGFAIWILLATPSAALNGTLIREGRLVSFATCTILAETVGLLVSLALLQAGYGVLALVGGRLGLQVAFLAVALVITRLRPAFDMAQPDLRALAEFSFNILASRLVITLRGYSGVFVVGAFLDPVSVGLFRAGQRVVGAFAELVGEPTRILAWRNFRLARDTGRDDGFQDCANRFFPVLAVVAIPGYLWIALFSDQIIMGLLGPDWQGAAPIISLLAAAGLLGAMGQATEPLMSLTGQTRLMRRLILAYALAGITLTVAGGPFGLIVLTVAQVVIMAIIFVTNLYIYRTRLGIAWLPVARNLLPAILPITLSIGALILLDGLEVLTGMNPLARVVLLSLPVLALYLLLLALVYRRALRDWRAG